MNVLILNSFFYWLTSFYYLRKYGMSLISFLWLYFSIFTIFGVLLMKDDLYFQLQQIDPSEEIHILPYLYIYITFQLITLPLRRINQDSFQYSEDLYNNRLFSKICNFINTISILYVFVKIVQVIMVMQIGFGAMHELASDSIIYPGLVGLPMRIINLVGRINNMIIMPIVVYYVINGYVNKRFSGGYLAKMTSPYILGVLLMGFVGGSRGAIFFGLMSLSFFYVLFFKRIPRKVHIRIWVPLILFLIVAYNVAIMIAAYRFDIDVSDSILSYLGQMWPNANYEVWQQPAYFPMGKRLFPVFFGANTGLDSDDWFYLTGVKGWLFVTVWGTIYTEFGEYISMLFFLGIFLLFNILLNKKRLYVFEIGLVSYIYFFCFSSLFGLSFTTSDYYGLFLTLGLIWYLKNSILGKRLFS